MQGWIFSKNIVDGTEDRERNMIYTRGVTNYIDLGEPSRKYLLEDDDYEAEQKLQYLEDGNYIENRSYYSQEYSRGGSGDQHTAYTEEGDSYARGIGAGAYEASRQSARYTRSHGGGYSIDKTLTQSKQGWDEASESQYGN